MRRPPPPPPARPAVRRRTDLDQDQVDAITGAAFEAGVPVAPWLAWARAAAEVWGPPEAVRRAVLGAAAEAGWVAPEAGNGSRGRLWGWLAR